MSLSLLCWITSMRAATFMSLSPYPFLSRRRTGFSVTLSRPFARSLLALPVSTTTTFRMMYTLASLVPPGSTILARTIGMFPPPVSPRASSPSSQPSISHMTGAVLSWRCVRHTGDVGIRSYFFMTLIPLLMLLSTLSMTHPLLTNFARP